MAPTPSPRQAPTSYQTPSRTPQSKHRLHFNPRMGYPHPSPNLISDIKEPVVPTEHPVEVIGRIRDFPDRKNNPPSAVEVLPYSQSVRIRTDIGYLDFGLDGVSFSEEEDIEGFYSRFVESRVTGVRAGAKCTIMMYGPTGSGKSHTMFGCSRQPGIVYRALRDILGNGESEMGLDDGGFGLGLFVKVAVLEIYNEEIYDLLLANPNGGLTTGLTKGNTQKVRLEVMGKKAKNATFISGNDAEKISKEVAKVEKRRIVKSTLCNERSSRSHCLIILDVPSVGGRLMLVDMAGSENIEQSGQLGFEAKMQTAKINQGNTALKRVVESIANGDSHVPFRDSKLTMLLQDSFEDDKSKILMILCASPDPKEIHKTISTLEYGAKAKCIVRVAHVSTPRDKMNNVDSSVLLRSRIVMMNQLIHKLQVDNKLKEKECDEVNKVIIQKEEELREVKTRMKIIEATGSAAKEEEIKLKVDERTSYLKGELAKMEDKMLRQEKELNFLRRRFEEMESDVVKCGKEEEWQDICGGRFMKCLVEACEGDQGMEKSMELDFGDQQVVHDVKEIREQAIYPNFVSSWNNAEDSVGVTTVGCPDKVPLTTVFEGEEEEEGEEDLESAQGDEVDKEVVEENSKCNFNEVCNFVKEDSASDRISRIHNIFRLCGDYRELSQHLKSHNTPPKGDDLAEVHVTWESSYKGNDLIKKIKVFKSSTLSDLRKLVEVDLEEENGSNQPFMFLLPKDPSRAPVTSEKEGSILVSQLPLYNCQQNVHMVSLRPVKKAAVAVARPAHSPLGALENTLSTTLSSPVAARLMDGFSPRLGLRVL